MQPFAYHAPDSLDEAIGLMLSDPAHSRYLAGGTDLYLDLEHKPQVVHHVIDLKRIPALSGIEATGLNGQGGWRIGALTLMADIEAHGELRAVFPALAESAGVVGGPPVRNRATLGGNIVNASPAADTATPLLALDASVTLAGSKGEREIPLAQLWQGPRLTTLAPGEVLTAINLPTPAPGSGNGFARLTRTAMDIALVNAAASVTLGADGAIAGLRLALGAVGPTVLAVDGSALQGRPVDEKTLAEVEALASAAAQPIDDVRASAAYRGEMAGVLARRATRQAAERAAKGSS